MLICLCPPHAAVEVAGAVAGFGFSGHYVDANAVSPQTPRTIGGRVVRFVDGGIIGPPPSGRRTTRLYLSGEQARTVAELFAGTALDARVVSEEPGAASAVKMAYAAWTKGRAALLLAIVRSPVQTASRTRCRKLPEHVKKYFENRGLNPEKLSPDVSDRLASASVPEIKLLDDLGTMLAKDPGPNRDQYVFVIH